MTDRHAGVPPQATRCRAVPPANGPTMTVPNWRSQGARGRLDRLAGLAALVAPVAGGLAPG